MRPKIAILAILILAVFAAGCRSVTTVYEYSDDGKTVVKKIVTDESAVKTVMDEMKNKNVAWGTNGWVAQLEATFVSQDTYMPTVKIRAANGNHWHISFLADVDPAAAIQNIMAAGLKIRANGVEVGSTVPESVSSVKSASAEKVRQ